MNTKIKDMMPSEATQRLRQIVVEGYHHLNRYQLPGNLGEMVERLKADLLKYMPGVTIETIDEAVTHEILHDEKLAKTPSLFSAVYVFQAVGKHYTKPAETRDMDKDELWQWKERLRWLEDKGLGNSPKAEECRWWIGKITKGDDEGETISLLDTCASMLAKMDAADKAGIPVAKHAEFKGVVVELPAFNSRREYGYLVMRKQLSPDSASHFFSKAIQAVNDDRLATHHHRLEKSAAATDPDVLAKCQRLAVLDWLRACNTRNTTPSAILTPLAEELSYFQFRRTR